jgi:hypothetical protein
MAVKKILRGPQRLETERVIAFRSHWGVLSEYCNPVSGNEKGEVEGELGRLGRDWLAPVPEAASLAALNQWLLSGCPANRGRTISGRNETVTYCAAQRGRLVHSVAVEAADTLRTFAICPSQERNTSIEKTS